MQGNEVLTIIASILVPMFLCFGWVLTRLKQVDDRITSIEKQLCHFQGYAEGVKDHQLKVKGE